MATTMGAAVADKPTDALWLAALPSSPRISRLRDQLPYVRPRAEVEVAARPADGVLSGLPGAVTDMTVSQDGRSLLAAHYADDTVTVIDIANLSVKFAIPGVTAPYAIAAADSDRVYVSSGSAFEDCVLALDTAVGAELAARPIKASAHGLAVSPAGDVLYVARSGDAATDIAAIDIESGKARSMAKTDDASVDAIELSPDGSRLYAALSSADGGAVMVIDTRAQRVLHTIPVGASIGDIAAHRDGRGVVALGWDDRLGGILTVVDATKGRVVDTIPVGGQPTQVVLSGSRAYLVDGDAVAVVNISASRTEERVSLGRPISCIAVSRDDACLYVGDYDGAVTALSVRTGLRAAS